MNLIATPARRPRSVVVALFAALVTAFSSVPAAAMELADVWRHASARSGIPVRILHGIAIVESGRVWSDGAIRPWPWTLNSPRTGSLFFAGRESAERELRRLIALGVTNIDIGIMQVNCGYHCSRVSDPGDLLDPATNIRVASEILVEYRTAKGGDVAKTVGAYHAGLHPDRAQRSKWYQDTVANRVRRLAPGGNA